MHLLDASALITGERDAYRIIRFPVFWNWLEHMGREGFVKIPIEQYEEIVRGDGDLVHWLADPERKAALVLNEEATVDRVREVVARGYGDLNDNELAQISNDAFLISYGLTTPRNRTIVTFEVSKPAKIGANRKIPDVCNSLQIPCCTLWTMVDALDFTTDWNAHA